MRTQSSLYALVVMQVYISASGSLYKVVASAMMGNGESLYKIAL